MIISIPDKLTPVRAVNFAKYIGTLEANCDNFEYDFSAMQHCRPFGLLIIAAAIRNNMKRFPRAQHNMINTEQTQGGRFAADFGFFQSMGIDIGIAREEDDVGNRYIPIKKITAANLHKQYSDTVVLNEKVDRHARVLSDVLVADLSKEVRTAVQYCFREIIRNTFEHANTDSLWVCGQYWPSRDEAEIAILDEGIGIYKSLKSNLRIKVNSCSEANMMALQPGLSSTYGQKQDPFDIWQNSGYGLYVASTLCAMNGGYFVLSSGDATALINGDGNIQTIYDSLQMGTAVCLNIRTNSRKLQSFEKTLTAIVSEGERKARENGSQRILSASKVTTVASMLKHIEASLSTDDNSVGVEPIGKNLIPINTQVTFEVLSTIDGDLTGNFEFNGDKIPGRLTNVTKANKKLYLSHHSKIQAVVRKYKNGVYCLLEPSYYKSKSKKG